MNAWETVERPDYRKYRMLREALVDVRALVTDDFVAASVPAAVPTPAPTTREWNAGLRLDGAANVAVLCAGVAIVAIAAASESLHPMLQGIA